MTKNIQLLVSSIVKTGDRFAEVQPLSEDFYKQTSVGTVADFFDRTGNNVSGKIVKMGTVCEVDLDYTNELVIEKVRTSIPSPRNVSSTPKK